MKNDRLDLKMRNLKLEIIDTQRCFLPAESFQNIKISLKQTISSIPNSIFYTAYIKDIKISCH